MKQPAPFRVTLARGMSAADRQTLLVALESQADVQTVAAKDPTVETIVAIIKEGGDIADALMKMGALAAVIWGWVQTLRKRGAGPAAQLERPGQAPLDLNHVADEQEVLAWLLQQPPTL